MDDGKANLAGESSDVDKDKINAIWEQLNAKGSTPTVGRNAGVPAFGVASRPVKSGETATKSTKAVPFWAADGRIKLRPIMSLEDVARLDLALRSLHLQKAVPYPSPWWLVALCIRRVRGNAQELQVTSSAHHRHHDHKPTTRTCCASLMSRLSSTCSKPMCYETLRVAFKDDETSRLEKKHGKGAKYFADNSVESQ